LSTMFGQRQFIWMLRNDEDGTSLFEAALTLPILILLSLGAMEFAWVFQNQQLVETGVRDAARYLARTTGGQSDQNPCSNTTQVGYAQNIAVYGKTTSGTPRVSGWSAGNVVVSCPSFGNSGGTYAGATTQYKVQVTTSFPDPALGLLKALGNWTPYLSATHVERSIGPG